MKRQDFNVSLNMMTGRKEEGQEGDLEDFPPPKSSLEMTLKSNQTYEPTATTLQCSPDQAQIFPQVH